MSKGAPHRVRRFTLKGRTLNGSFGPDKLAPRAQRSGALQLESVRHRKDKITIHGVYSVHGNQERDIARIAEGAGLVDTSVLTESLQAIPCGTPGCNGCRPLRNPRAVDVEALAGSWDLGVVHEGFDIVHRVALPGGFGNEVIEANRGLLGDFPVETGEESGWTPMDDVALVFGTPPCSGWSLMNTSKNSNARGPDSPIQQCTWGLIRYAGRCTGTDGQLGPDIIGFESVQQAYTQGRDLMTSYSDLLRHTTGQDYTITHVMMSGATIGAAQLRHRYFYIAHRIPFGVDIDRVGVSPVTYREAIGDLQGGRVQLAAQPYAREAETEFQSTHRRDDGMFDWHVTVSDGTEVTNIGITMNVLAEAKAAWRPGENQRDLIGRLYQEGRLPARAQKLIDPETGTVKGWGGPMRIVPDSPGRVIHGGGASQFVHWSEERWLTVRELTRLMGYPDEWTYPQEAKPPVIGSWIGKNAPVESTVWISHWIKESLEGRPGRLQGVPDRLGEKTINVTHAWKGADRIIAEIS